MGIDICFNAFALFSYNVAILQQIDASEDLSNFLRITDNPFNIVKGAMCQISKSHFEQNISPKMLELHSCTPFLISLSN